MALEEYKLTDRLLSILIWGILGYTINFSQALHQEHEGEFCNHDTFSPRCPDNHVIEITRATFGRTRTGLCAQNVIQPCDVDALPLLRHRCSGLEMCRVEVSDIDKLLVNETRKVCSHEYRLHLYSAYRCIPIETEPNQLCIISESPEPITVSQDHGYLASLTTRRTAKGSQNCPWHIRGRPGQTIQIVLHNYNSIVDPSDSMCYIYASIRERALPDSDARLMDCGFNNYQGKVFHSLSESLDVVIVDPDESRNFVLEFKALGCPDVETSGGAEVVRKGNTTTIRCDDASWTLQCRDGEWYGDRGECTVPVTQEESFPWPKEWSQEFTVVLIIAVAVLIAVVIVVIGVCIVRRNATRDFQPVSQNGGEYGVYNLRGPVVPSSKYYYPTLPMPPESICPGGSGSESSHYTTTMQRHQAVPAGFKTPSMDAFALNHAPHLLQQSDLTSCASCPVHSGTYHDRVGASGWQTFPVRRPDHIYESPKAVRRQLNDLPFYHELDPKEVEKQLREQQQREQQQQQQQPTQDKQDAPVSAKAIAIATPVPPVVLPIPTEDELVSDDEPDPLPPPPPPLPPDNQR